MKKILLILVLVSTLSCHDQTISWLVGESNLIYSGTFDPDSSTKLKMDLKSVSYCSGSGIDLIVRSDGNQIFSKTITVFPYSKTIPIQVNSTIMVETKSINLDNGETCKRLGDVELTATKQ